MAVITISEELGAGGQALADAAAGHLGYRAIGSDLIAEAARRYGLPEDKLMRLGQAKPTLFERLGMEARLYIAVIQTALLDFACEDNVILLGRGGQWLLRGVPHALCLRVIAPFEDRVARVTQRLAGPDTPQLTAGSEAVADLVRREDRNRAGRMRYLYDRDIDDPRLYDLVINTARLPLPEAARLVGELARQPVFATTPDGTQLIADRLLASRVEVALAFDPTTQHQWNVSVTARSGVVTLRGVGALGPAGDVALRVDGVVDVTLDELPVVPPLQPI